MRFPHRLDVEGRELSSNDQYFAPNASWKKKIRRLHGFLQAVSAREGIFLDKEGMKITHRFFTAPPIRPTILDTDRLCDSKPNRHYPTRFFSIVGMTNDIPGAPTILTLLENKGEDGGEADG